MANPLWWGKPNKDTSKDLFSTTFFSTRLAPLIFEDEALKIPAVKASVELISSSIAQLPIYLYEFQNYAVNRVYDDPREKILNKSANPYSTGQVLKKQLVKDYLLHGVAYLLNRNGKLYYLKAKNMHEVPYTDDGITVAMKEYRYDGVREVVLHEPEVIVIDSGTNGLLTDAGELFQVALDMMDYNKGILSNGAVPTGILKAASRLTQPAIDRLRETFSSLYGGPSKAGKTVILEEGLDYSPLALSPDKLQMNDSQKHVISEIARVFNIPQSMIDSSANKYNSLPENRLSFLQSCVGPIIFSIENSLNQQFLSQNEQDNGFYFKFDTSELIRVTEKEKVATVSEAYNKGLISFNEARNKIDLPKVDKDFYLLSLGSVLKDANTGALTIPNTGVVDNKSGGDTTKNENDGIKKQ